VDIWRAYKVKDVAVKDWIRLVMREGNLQEDPIVLVRCNRGHDGKLIKEL